MDNPIDFIRDHARTGARVRLEFFEQNDELMNAIGLMMARAIAAGHKILACGNGGSAGDAQHFAGEIVGRFLIERPGLPAVALSTDTSVITSIANDYGYDRVYARQVEGLGQPGDVLLAISTSGNSASILNALEEARRKGMTTVGMSGKGGGAMAPLCDFLIDVNGPSTALIQEVHIACVHLMCALVDHYLFEDAAALKRT